MRKQVFSLMIMLALVVLAGSTYAQNGTGAARLDAYLVAIGATTTFTIDNDGAVAADIDWNVYDATTLEMDAFGAIAEAGVDGTEFNYVTSPTDMTDVANPDVTGLAAAGTSTIYINWLEAQDNDLYVVQARATTNGGTCSSIRRFYISVFDFDVNVYLCQDNTGTTDYAVDQTTCSSWDGLVVANNTATPAVDPLDDTGITTAHGDYLNEDISGSGTPKYTDTYFRVEISLSGAPANFGVEDFKWRMRYSQPGAGGNESYYSITCTEAWADATGGVTPVNVAAGELAQFLAEGGNTYIGDDGTDGTPTLEINDFSASTNDWDGDNQNEIYFPAAATGTDDGSIDASYLFAVRTHNLLGQAAMAYNMQVELAELEFTLLANTDYNNGRKYHSTSANSPKLDGVDDTSVSMTINQSPATSVIGIAE